QEFQSGGIRTHGKSISPFVQGRLHVGHGGVGDHPVVRSGVDGGGFGGGDEVLHLHVVPGCHTGCLVQGENFGQRCCGDVLESGLTDDRQGVLNASSLR